MLLRPLLTVLIFLVWGLSTPPAQSQSQQPSPSSQSQPYTIQANSRVVLTDVTVTDKGGNPVRGLPQSAFRIFDNSKPETIDTFEEHTGTPTAVTMEPAAAKGVSSNDYLLHPPPALNVLLLDISNLEIADQMYLYYELTKFFQGAGRWPACGYLSARRQQVFSRAGLYQRPRTAAHGSLQSHSAHSA